MPTYHYLQNQGKLIMQSREIGQKRQFGQFLDDFEVKYFQIFMKNRFHSNWRSYLVLTSSQKPKKLLEPFFRKMSVSDFKLLWRPFREYLQIKNFFQKCGSVTFLSFVVA